MLVERGGWSVERDVSCGSICTWSILIPHSTLHTPRRPSPQQLPTADDLHRLPVGPDEGHQRLWHLAGPAAHRLGLLLARQVVHLEQHQTRVAFSDEFVVAVLLFQGEAEARQVLRPVLVALEGAVVADGDVLHRGQFPAEGVHGLPELLRADEVCHFLQRQQPQGLLVAIALNERDS